MPWNWQPDSRPRHGATAGAERAAGSLRWTRARKRVLLVLLTGAADLSGVPVREAAMARVDTVSVTLEWLERHGWVGSRVGQGAPGAPVRRYYWLTPEGRAGALDVLGLGGVISDYESR